MTQLEKIKIKLGISLTDISKDELLNVLLESAAEYIKTYSNRDTLTSPLLIIQEQLTVIYYNRLGTEGEQGYSEGGISTTIYVLNDDLPVSIKSQLNSYRLLKGARIANASTQ